MDDLERARQRRQRRASTKPVGAFGPGLIRKLDPAHKYRAYRCGDYWHVTTQTARKAAGFKDGWQ